MKKGDRTAMAIPAWYPDELAHAGPEHLDPDYVAGYDRKAGVDVDADVALLRELGLNETSTLVDLGAGSGELALAVAPLCRRVVAVDVSAPMLALLRDKAARRGVGNVEIVQAGFLSYEHQDAPADFVYTRNALHHLPDFWKAIALERTAAILRPGGVLRLHDLVYSFDPGEAARVVAPWLAGAAPSPEVGWTKAEYETHLREEFSTFSWLLEPMLERAGFDIRDVSHAPPRVYSAYTCVRRG
jgi:ubiquinone/menaquinone biosynthesis C-methylase UbiE